jgi:DnaJ family protein C protein 13
MLGSIAFHPVATHACTQYDYVDEFAGIALSPKAPNEFIITIRKKGSKKESTETFSAENRADILTAALVRVVVHLSWGSHLQANHHLFCGDTRRTNTQYSAQKLRWNDTRKEVRLAATPYGIVQYDTMGRQLAVYAYTHIEALCLVSDYPGGMVIFYGGCARMHFFALEARDELLRRVQEDAASYIGLDRKYDVLLSHVACLVLRAV